MTVAFILVAALLSACGGPPAPARAGKPGGTLTVAAGQEPDCADWIGSCAGEPWGYWALEAETVPKAFVVDQSGNYVPGPVLAGAPDLDAGPPQRVTYHLNPRARWSDGAPITSADIRYTWDQIAHGSDIYSDLGYSDIVAVDTPSADTAVATFAKPYAAWRDLFGADQYGILPSHILAGGDRDGLMKDGYGWSGGPWMLEGGAAGWVKGRSMTLVPNPRYWGAKPLLSRVVFQFNSSPAAQVQAYRQGQAQIVYTQSDFEVVSQLRGAPGAVVGVYPGINDEAIWFNAQSSPLDRPAVRKALAYAIDRQALVQALFGRAEPNPRPLQSSEPSSWSSVYTPAFSQYHLNLAMVNELMTGDGWHKGADGTWTRSGQQASIQLKSTLGNPRRAQMEAMVQSQWRTAGFQATVQNESVGALFDDDLPHGNFQAAIYADVFTARDPGQCILWCSSNIPAPANGYSGQNWTGIADPSLDDTWGKADRTLDDGDRAALLKQGQQAVARLVPLVPVATLPDVLVRNSQVRGPVSDNAVMGPFWNLEDWYFK